MDKKKIVTSLTLAGILTAGVIEGNVNAASNNSLGVCKDILTGESLVPYVFDSKADALTIEAIKGEYKDATVIFKDSSRTTPTTGDTIKTAKGDKTILVYGDVNRDGKISTADALYAQSIVLKEQATDIQKLAADVFNNKNKGVGEVTTADANRIQAFVLEGGKLVDNLPTGEKEVYDDEYVASVSETINNQNYDSVSVKFTPKENNTFKNTDTALSLEIYKLGENGEYGTTNLFDTTASASKIGPSASNSGFETGAKVKVSSDLREKEVKIDLHSYIDADTEKNNGTFKLQLKRGSKVVAETTLTTHAYSTSDILADVFIVRTGSNDASVGLMGYKGNIAKVYCYTKPLVGGTNPAKIKEIVENGVGVTVTNNEVLPTKEFTDGDKHTISATGAKINYVLEDTYGNRVLGTEINVADHTATTTSTAKIIGIVETNTTDLKFDIETNEDITSTSAKIILYRDDVAVEDLSQSLTTTNKKATITVPQNKMNKPGKYSIKAYLLPSTNQPSGVYNSKDSGVAGIIEIKQLPSVSADSIKYSINSDGNKILGWDYDRRDVQFKVEWKNYGAADSTYSTSGFTSATPSDKFVINDPGNNTMYTIRVTAELPTTQTRLLNAEGTVKDICDLDLGNAAVGDINYGNTNMRVIGTENTVKMTGILPMSISNRPDIKNFEYRLKVVQLTNDDSDEVKTVYNQKVELIKTPGNVATYETPAIPVEGEGKSYRLRLYAIYNGQESAPLTLSGRTFVSSKDLNINHIIRSSKNNLEDNEIYIDSSKVYFKDNEYNLSQYSQDLQNILTKIASGLYDGDKLTVNGKDIAIELGTAEAKTSTFTATTNNNALKDYTLTIQGNRYERELDLNSNTFVSTKLVGGSFKVSNETNANVILAGTSLTGNTATVEYTLEANKDNTINTNKVKADNESAKMKYDTSSNKLTFVPGNSALAIENKKSASLAVEFAGNPTRTGVQSGKVDITSKTGDVTISTSKANVTGEVKVDVKDNNLVFTLGDGNYISGAITAIVENNGATALDLSKAELTGSKKVIVTNRHDEDPNHTVTEKTTITGLLANKAPFTTSSDLTIVPYANGATALTSADSAIITLDNDSTVIDAINFINNLGIDVDANVKINITDANADGIQEITLTFDGEIPNYELKNALALK